MNMKVHFYSFRSGCGDCIILLLEEDGEQFSILMDCGRYTSEIRSFINERLAKRIDLLIVSHIDSDHISGVIQMLKITPDLSIGDIWFNCYQRNNDHPSVLLTEDQTRLLQRLYSRVPQVIDIIDSKISANQSISLSSLLLSNPNWRTKWERLRIVKGANYSLGDASKFGTLHVLSPTPEVLSDLDSEYYKMFYEAFYGKHPDCEYEGEESIYELLIRVANDNDEYLSEINKISAINVTPEYIRNCCENPLLPLSIPNKASISVIWEYNEHRILLLGDSDSKQVCSAIHELYSYEEVVNCDIIKVSHHGSKHSTSKELLSSIDSGHYVFSGGTGNERPHIDAISRIISRPFVSKYNCRNLHFSHENEWTNCLQDEVLMNSFQYCIDYYKEKYVCEYEI